MSNINKCIKDKDWGALALITCEAMKIMKEKKEKRESIRETRNIGKEVRHYEIDKVRKVKSRK